MKLVSDDGGVKTEDVYFDKKLPNAIGGASASATTCMASNRELFMCVNFKTGEQKWKKNARWRLVNSLRRWPALRARRKQQRRCAHRSVARRVQRTRPFHAARYSRETRRKGVGLSGSGRRPALHSRLGYALVLRRESRRLAPRSLANYQARPKLIAVPSKPGSNTPGSDALSHR